MKFIKSLNLKRIICLLTTSALLSGCVAPLVPLVVGGGMAETVVVATDRRTTVRQLQDKDIELRAASRIKDALDNKSHVNVTSFNLQVLLTGQVPSDKDRQTIYKIVSEVENVTKVFNEVEIGPVSGYVERSHDALLSGKVKAGIIDASDLMVNVFTIVVENGTVYLMGRVTANEANRATEIARNVNGVTKVVRIFEPLSEEALRALNPPINTFSQPDKKSGK